MILLGFSKTIALLTSMLEIMLTSSESRPSKIINEIDSKIIDKTGNSSGSKSIKNFQKSKIYKIYGKTLLLKLYQLLILTSDLTLCYYSTKTILIEP